MIFRVLHKTFFLRKKRNLFYTKHLEMREYCLESSRLSITALAGCGYGSTAVMQKDCLHFREISYASIESMEEFPKEKVLRLFLFSSFISSHGFGNYDECFDWDTVSVPDAPYQDGGKWIHWTEEKRIPKEACITVPMSIENYDLFKSILEEKTGKNIIRVAGRMKLLR